MAEAYAKVDATRGWPKSHPGLPVLVRVVAPPGMPERAPIDLVAVLDVGFSSFAPANRMDLLKRAMEHVIEQLSNNDRLAVVSVQTPAVPGKYGLMEMTASGRKVATAMVPSLGFSDKAKLSTALNKAVGILQGRADKTRLGFIILISDGDDSFILWQTLTFDDSFIVWQTVRPEYSVHAFGFRDAHNARAMHFIANSSRGTYGILNDEHDRITETFTACVKKITSVVAVQTEVDIVCSNTNATLSAIESGRFKSNIEDDRKSGHVVTATLEAGAVRNFIVYVDNVDEGEYDELPRLLSVRVKYQLWPPGEESTVERQVVVVRKCTTESKEVAAEIVRVEAVRIVRDILLKYKDNAEGLVDAVAELHQQWLLLKDSDYGREATAACLICGLDTEIEEMEARMRRCSGLPYMLSWHACHTLQHQTRAVATPPKRRTSAVWKICAVCFGTN